MADQKETIYLQNTSNTSHKTDDKESRKSKMFDKVVGELKLEDKSSIDGKSKQDEGSDNKESGKIDDTGQKSEDESSSDQISKQEDGTDSKKSDIIDDTGQKSEDESSSDQTSKQEDGTDSKKSDIIDDTGQKSEDESSSDQISKQEDGTDSKKSDIIDDTGQKSEDESSSDQTSKQEDGTDSKKSDIIDDTGQKSEDESSSDQISKQEDGTDNKKSDIIDDTGQKSEDESSSDQTSKQEDGTDSKKSDIIDETEHMPEDEISSDKIFNQENGPENKKSDIIDGTDQKSEDQISSDKTSEQENRIDNKESSKMDDTEQKPEDTVSCDEKSKQEDGTDNKESRKIDGELKPEEKICIINKSRIEDGPPLALKINNVESGESRAELSIKNEMWIDNEEPGGSGAKYSLEDETCINYNTFDSDDRRQPTTIDEKQKGDMWLCNFGTLENTVNNRKRYQNQNEGLDGNELYLLKKIKIEDTSDDQFQEMWKYLEYDSSNFNQWVNILELVDDQNIEVNARMAYSKFLELYPLCYGYWKKYANFEKRNNNIHEFEKVLENGLSAIPISVDLWIYYMTYLRTERYDEEYQIRNEFERSLSLCGLDYHSDQLWHDYISWEVERNELFNAVKIYYRLICIPTLNYLKNFFKFQEFIFQQLPEHYLELMDLLKRRNIIIQSLGTNHNTKSSNDDSIPPGEDFHQNTEFTEDHIVSLVRIGIINEWHFFHKETAKEFKSRKMFEENIRRPHFHVNELDSAQIKNWENYIKFERQSGNHIRIVYLYERCLITCVSNEEFWLNYLEYLSFVNLDVTVLLSDVFKRSLFHHPKSLLLNLKFFDFCETQGWEETAVETITQLEIIHPDSREVSIKIINLARKKKDGTLGLLYKHYLNCSQSKSFSSYIAVRYARFVWKHDRQLNLAFDILYDTIRNNDISVNDSLEIYLTLVEIKMELNPKDHLSVLKTIDDIILQCNLYKEKLLFSKKKLEYTEDYIQDYDLLRLAKIEYKHLKNACFREKKQSSNNTM